MISTTVLIIAILYLFGLAFTMQTKNFVSSLYFKYIPFLIGVGLIFVAVVQLGWLVVV